jgi:hypothetical protein
MSSESCSRPYRCAVYFAPTPFGDWWQAGSQWLGRCAASGAHYAPPDIHGIDPEKFQNWTSDPRRYGWHATLKAPFQLAQGKNIQDLSSRMRLLAQHLPPFTLPRLQVSTQGGFLALRPTETSAQIDAAAATCVKELHDMAKPLGPVEMAHRRKTPLTAEQDRLLESWGYPWVFEHFKFHLSLTGPLEQTTLHEQEALIEAAKLQFDALEHCRFEHLALFIEPEKGADFELTEWMELKG